MHRKSMIFICCVIIGTMGAAFFFYCTAEGSGSGGCGRDGYGAVISERSDGLWAVQADKRYGLGAAGSPVFTRRELYTETEKGGCTVTFFIDGIVTQQLIDGYGQSVWRACEKAAAEENQSGSGYGYKEMRQAGKLQEPVDSYLWYYRFRGQKYRIGIYSTEMENGVSGGLVLKIEPVS
ncbi:MAG: hypothetical protein UC961_10585 [Emergencia sp.]|nr:hypothetical protein [Emergencia sp.]